MISAAEREAAVTHTLPPRTLLDRVFPPDQCCPVRARQWDAVGSQGVDTYERMARRQAAEASGEERVGVAGD